MSDYLKIYFVDGNISSGKSTILKELEEAGFRVSYEPVDVWTKNYIQGGTNILDLFYKDMHKWSFALQMTALVTRMRRLVSEIEKKDERRVLFVERSVLTDMKVFAKNLTRDGCMEELGMKVQKETYDFIMQLIQHKLETCEIHHIYVRTTPEECFRRKKDRNRLEEDADSMSLDYLVKLHNLHEEWFSGTDMRSVTVMIDGMPSRFEVFTQIFTELKIELNV